MNVDVFLSHNSSDKAFVVELANRLREDGIVSFLDEWEFTGGDQIQEKLANALERVSICLVVLGPHGLGPYQKAEITAVIHRRIYERSDTFLIIPVLMPGVSRGERTKLPLFLADTLWIEFWEEQPYEKAYRQLLRAIRRDPNALPDGHGPEQCPYCGLEYFDVKHAPYFHGREALTQWLLTRLRRQPGTTEAARFLSIIGASGSGKSSLARAGIVSRLKAGDLPESDHWAYAIFRPGPDPLYAFAKALVKARADYRGKVEADGEVKVLEDALYASEKALDTFSDQLFYDTAGRRLVILVDQFEEFFTQSQFSDDAEVQQVLEARRTAFVHNLYYAATVPLGRTIILLTMRADFYGKCTGHEKLSLLLSDSHQELVPPMNEIALRRAIEAPAWQTKCSVEPGLAALLVNEVAQEAGNLPLLQFALAELWKNREGNRLTSAAYETKGGLEGALEKRANDLLSNLSLEQQELCRRLFLRMTQPGVGTEDTKRRVARAELEFVDSSPADLEKVIETLSHVEVRLVVSSTNHLEVAHEALIKHWSQLRKWLEADREGLLIHRRLTDAALEWEEAAKWKDEDRRAGLLYRTPRLETAVAWRELNSGLLSGIEAGFHNASEKRQTQEIYDERARIAKELATSSRFLIGISVVAVLAVAFALLAGASSFRAFRAEREAYRQTAATSWGQAFASRDTEQDSVAAGWYFLRAAYFSTRAGAPKERRSALLASESMVVSVSRTFPSDGPVTIAIFSKSQQ